MWAKNRIYPVQIFTLVMSAMLGVHLLTIQHDLVMKAGQDGWISMMLAGIVIVVSGIWVNFPLAAMYPENDIPEIILLQFGKVFGRIILTPIILYILLETGFTIRVFVQATKVYLLSRTPITALVIFIVISIMSVAAREIKAIASAIDFMFPVYMVSLLTFILLAFLQVDIERVKPVLYHNTAGVLGGVLPAFGAVTGYASINYFLCYTIGPKNAKKWYISAITASVLLYSVITFLAIAGFGPEDIKTMVYPTLTLSKSIDFPISLLERLESLLAIVWIPGVFAWMTVLCFVSIRNLSVFFSVKSKKQKYVAYVLGLLLCIIALMPENEISALRYLNSVEVLGTVLALTVLPIMTVIAFIKKRRSGAK